MVLCSDSRSYNLTYLPRGQQSHGCLVKVYANVVEYVRNVIRLPKIRWNKRAPGDAENPAQNIFMWTRTSFDLDQVEISSSSQETMTHFWISKDNFHTCLWKTLLQESRVPARNLSNSESPSKDRVILAGWGVLVPLKKKKGGGGELQHCARTPQLPVLAKTFVWTPKPPPGSRWSYHEMILKNEMWPEIKIETLTLSLSLSLIYLTIHPSIYSIYLSVDTYIHTS